MSAQTDEVVREVHIAAAPADVFPYFTDPEKLVAWKAATVELDARPGGRFRMDVTGRGDVAEGEFLDIDPPHRVSFTWRWENERRDSQPVPTPSVVEVTLTPDGNGTLLRLVHRGIPGPNRDASAAGWAHYLARLELAATGNETGPTPGPPNRQRTYPDSERSREVADGHAAKQDDPATPLRRSHERARPQRGRPFDHSRSPGP